MFADRTNWNLSPNALTEALERRRAAGKRILDLTVSNPTECGFVYDEKEILAALSQKASLTYEPDPRGLRSARRAVANYYQDFGAQIPVDDIFLTTSTSEAYSFVFRILCNPGDELLVPEPSYPLFDFLAEIQDVKLVRYPLVYDHGWQMDFHGLERAITSRSRGVIVVHPNNPTGQFCKRAEMAKLSELCSSQGLAVIADEVFLDFGLMGETPATFASNSRTLTFTLSGISKICGLPQMKLAWIVLSGAQELKQQASSRVEVISDTYLSLNAPTQWALPDWLATGVRFRNQALERIKSNLAELDRQLGEQHACSRLIVEGGWCAILRVPSGSTDEELSIQLLEREGVLVHPGHFYGLPQRGSLVVGLLATTEMFAEAIHRVLKLVIS
jgi:alanine-synthesizing transaminase